LGIVFVVSVGVEPVWLCAGDAIDDEAKRGKIEAGAGTAFDDWVCGGVFLG